MALKNGIVKKYYLKNISNIKLTDKEFEVNDNIDTILKNSISIWFQADETPFEVKLYADKIVAKYFKRKPLPTQQIYSINSDDSLEFSVKITHEMEIIPIVKYWILHLYILEPMWIKKIIDEDVQKYLQHYIRLGI